MSHALVLLVEAREVHTEDHQYAMRVEVTLGPIVVWTKDYARYERSIAEEDAITDFAYALRDVLGDGKR